MKKNKRLIILFSIILVLGIIVGYTVYKSYNRNQNNNEEEINLGAAVISENNAGGGGNSSNNNNNSGSNNSTSSSKPCCDTCNGYTYCLANCKSCNSNQGSGNSSEKEKDGVCEKNGSGLFSAIIAMTTDPDCK